MRGDVYMRALFRTLSIGIKRGRQQTLDVQNHAELIRAVPHSPDVGVSLPAAQRGSIKQINFRRAPQAGRQEND